MSHYYYLISSLPSLDLKAAPGITMENFRISAEDCLSKSDFSDLHRILADDPKGVVSSTALRYLEWDKAVRNALVRLRAEGSDMAADCREGENLPEAAVLAAALYKTDSPLKAEQLWDAERWSYLENLKTGHYFDFEAVVVYALQLRLAERNARFQEKAGEEQYELLYKTVIENESKIGVKA